MAQKENFPLGQLLIEKGIISPQQLQEALDLQKTTGKLLGSILIELGFVDEETIFLPVIAGQLDVEYVNLKALEIPRSTLDQIPAKFATHYKVVPIRFDDNTLTIASITPLDIQILDEVGLVVNAEIKTVLASEKEILEAIRKYYGVGAETIEQMMGTVARLRNPGQDQVDDLDDMNSEASISKFLNQILLEAYRDRATDIHIEPFEHTLQIRYRVDGILYDAKVPSNIVHFKDSIISRIKVLCSLNIAEKRMPQDGRFKVRMGEVELDFRVSTLPTSFGESVVLRILNTTRLYRFEELNLSSDELAILEHLIVKPHGIVFLTGPTGSGKTTTLYSCLSRINTEEKKIITIEDPIEYQLRGITQVQISPAVGLTFAQGLRSMLRHDPDVMMVGEVRDKETADIAIQVALTGHLVFSTLHTNDAASGVTRLLDMGVDPFLITSTVECFIAQRLVRILCQKCKKQVTLTAEMIKDLQEEALKDVGKDVFEAHGCEACHGTGYLGRQSIYEFLVMSARMRDLVMKRVTANEIKALAVAGGMRTLRQAGWEKVVTGISTVQEILRVTQEEV